MGIALWWIRRDLRLDDNQALQGALSGGSAVIPVFILDPHLLAKSAPPRTAFLFAGLQALDQQLRALGSRLVIRKGLPEDELGRLVLESGATKIFAEQDFSPYARRRDAAVAARLPLQLVSGLTVHPPSVILKPDGNPYRVFTPFSKAWKALPFPIPAESPPPAFLAVSTLDSLPIPPSPAPASFPPGEIEAKRRLHTFLSGPVFSYASDRNRMDLEGTSALSPYLRFGMISARQAAWAAVSLMATRSLPPEILPNIETWLNELIWREFYQSILYHFPFVLQQAFNPALRRIAWNSSSDELDAWKNGLTGYPVVDACMRQLSSTGWMHNRGRMICASFLVKDLLQNWQQGERWFMARLIDGDPAANNGGWQWTAGVGTDAAPYFRIFNPASQSLKCDPQGQFIRTWVPELEAVPTAFIHQPWLMDSETQNKTGCRLGKDYPARIVDHPAAKIRTLAAFAAAYQNFMDLKEVDRPK